MPRPALCFKDLSNHCHSMIPNAAAEDVCTVPLVHARAAWACVPREGLFSLEGITFAKLKTADGLLHDDHCPAVNTSSAVKAEVTLDQVLSSEHHPECLTLKVFPFINIFDDNFALTPQGIMTLRASVVENFEALKTRPATPIEVFNRLQHPFDFLSRPHLSPYSDGMTLRKLSVLGWAAAYLQRLRETTENSYGFPASDPHAFDEEFHGAFKEKFRTPGYMDYLSRASSSSVNHSKDVVLFSPRKRCLDPFEVASAYNDGHQAYFELFRVSPARKLLLASPVVADFLDVPDADRLVFSEAPSKETLETVDGIFTPYTVGPTGWYDFDSDDPCANLATAWDIAQKL